MAQPTRDQQSNNPQKKYNTQFNTNVNEKKDAKKGMDQKNKSSTNRDFDSNVNQSSSTASTQKNQKNASSKGYSSDDAVEGEDFDRDLAGNDSDVDTDDSQIEKSGRHTANRPMGESRSSR